MRWKMAWEGDEWLGEGHPSVFTHFLVEGLRTGAADLDGDGKIALDELYDYVYERVLTSGHAKQTPHKWAQKIEGQIVIAQSAVVRPAAYEADQSVGVERIGDEPEPATPPIREPEDSTRLEEAGFPLIK